VPGRTSMRMARIARMAVIRSDEMKFFKLHGPRFRGTG
jgi:Ni,Fe-hydrogenase III large subunit